MASMEALLDEAARAGQGRQDDDRKRMQGLFSHDDPGARRARVVHEVKPVPVERKTVDSSDEGEGEYSKQRREIRSKWGNRNTNPHHPPRRGEVRQRGEEVAEAIKRRVEGEKEAKRLFQEGEKEDAIKIFERSVDLLLHAFNPNERPEGSAKAGVREMTNIIKARIPERQSTGWFKNPAQIANPFAKPRALQLPLIGALYPLHNTPTPGCSVQLPGATLSLLFLPPDADADEYPNQNKTWGMGHVLPGADRLLVGRFVLVLYHSATNLSEGPMALDYRVPTLRLTTTTTTRRQGGIQPKDAGV
eukprot:gene38656-60872_t